MSRLMLPMLLSVALLPSVAAAAPLELTHQGRLLDSTGAPLAGPVDVTVSIFDDASAGTQVWTDTFSAVELNEGFYTLILGSGEAIDASDFGTDDSLFVELSVDGGAPLPSRFALTSVPWALHAASATAVSGGAVDATTITAESVDATDVAATTVTSTSVVSDSVTINGVAAVTDWSNLPNIPSELADGDADTLGDVGACTEGQIIAADANGKWACANALTAALPSDATVGGQAIATVDTVATAESWAKTVHIRSLGLIPALTQGVSWVKVDGEIAHDVGRGLNVVVLDRATGDVVSGTAYDTHNSVTEAERLVTDLEALDESSIIVVHTHDQPAYNRTPELIAALQRCGASDIISAPFAYRSAYALVGICDRGPASGAEYYAGDVADDPNSVVEVTVTLRDGTIESPNGGKQLSRFFEKSNSQWSASGINSTSWTPIGDVSQQVTVNTPTLLIMTANGHMNNTNQSTGEAAYFSFFVTDAATSTATNANTGGDYGQGHIYGAVTTPWAPLSLTQMYYVGPGTYTIDLRHKGTGTWSYNGMGIQVATVPMR